MSVFAFFFSLVFKLAPNIYATKSVSDSAIEYKAEYLYKKINDILLKYKDVPPEKFDDVCKEYMVKDIASLNLLNKKDFEEKSKNSIILYRGINEKQFADSFKKGIIYMPSNIRNVRGMGIYATTSFECAKYYSDKNDPQTIIRMLIPKSKIKILEDEYLEKLKEKIRTMHPEEYGDFSKENKENYIFDSALGLLNEKFGELFEKIDREQIKDPDEIMRLQNELGEQLKKDPIIVNRKRYFKENKASVFYNSGLLTKLLGYDVLHSIGSLRDNIEIMEEEYLIVEPRILSILNE